MKKCPNCEKEFPDTMRFCQTDGTPLVDVVADAPAEDPLRTTVVRQEDIASSIPASDPFRTMVAGSGPVNDDSGDLLQLPEEVDPMKTMVAAPIIADEKPVLEEVLAETPRFEEIRNEILAETPVTPSDSIAPPADPLPVVPDYSFDPTVLQPEPPKFSEPSPAPPSFGESQADEAPEDLPQTMIQGSWDNGPKIDDSPFSKPSDSPTPSPFDPAPVSFDAPPSPFEAPKSPFDPPFDEPQPAAFNPPPVSFDAPRPYEEPVNQFGGAQFDQMNQGFGAGQSMQQSEWAPPTPPDQSWQDQGLGANTPFQPPPAGLGGENKTLAIVSLVSGILGIVCCGAPAGIVALITGYMAKNNCDTNPQEYGGRGMAVGGMILGAISLVLTVILIILQIFLGVLGNL